MLSTRTMPPGETVPEIIPMRIQVNPGPSGIRERPALPDRALVPAHGAGAAAVGGSQINRGLGLAHADNPGELDFNSAHVPRLSRNQAKSSKTPMKMAGAAGLEPVTSAVTGQRSNQLSYIPTKRGTRQ